MASKADMEKTAFRCHRGSFEFSRMPFGILNGPQHFQRYIESVLGGLNFRIAMVFIDDICVFSQTFDQHMKDLQEVFDALRKGGMHLKAKKCVFAADEVKYLGHIVGVDGVRPDPVKTKVIDEFMPKSRADLSSFNGMCSFYRKYIKNYAHKARPLTVYINSRKPFEGMTQELSDAVALLKAELTSVPIMAHPNFDLPFEIHCDASPFALGATLVQQVGEEEKVVMYISRTLKKHEVSYHQYEREMLAVVWSVAVFRPYTTGARFKVVTDNAAVANLRDSTATNPRLMRWLLALNAHRIDYSWRSGAKHVVPDALSRGFNVPADFVWEKNDDVDALCSMEEIDTLQKELCERWESMNNLSP
jgi:hypothetical protein